MPTYGGNGQFGGSGYNNPQMNPSWNNQSSQFNQWQNNWAPDEASWSGGAPGHQGQNLSYNPQTGEQSWLNSSEGLRFGNTNSGPGGTGTAWYIDPKTGMKTINMDYIQGIMGGMFGQGSGGGGYQSYSPSDYQGGQVTPGQGYGGFDYSSIGSGIDPSAVIAAQEYKLNEAMQGDFAKAGGRMGQSGFAMSTPYANSLGDASRKASQDRNAMTLQYQYDAAQQQAQRDLAQQLQAGQQDFGGWQQQYQGDLQSQMFNQGQNFDQWMAQNQWGMQDNQGQNNWNQDQNSQQQQLMAMILGGMF